MLNHVHLDIIESLVGGHVVQKAWQCDVLAANYDQICLHNSFRSSEGKNAEEKFVAFSPHPRSLTDLLWDDFNFLIPNPTAAGYNPSTYSFIEIFGATPNAHHMRFHQDDEIQTIICFRSPLIWFIHSAFSKVEIMLSSALQADCIPEHDTILESENYSDHALLAGFFNDIEVFYNEGMIEREVLPKHLGSPYNYCERVEGARRFILGHELGHSRYGSDVQQTLLQHYKSAGVDPPQDSWLEEFWCDCHGINLLLNKYVGQPLIGAELYEIENALVGVLEFFTILDIIEMLFDTNGISHPPSIQRRDIARLVIQKHDVYKQSVELQKTLPVNWSLLNGFWRIATGAYSPDSFMVGGFAGERKFQDSLTPFGKNARLSLMNSFVERENGGAYSSYEDWWGNKKRKGEDTVQ